jgi:hypothetical protein
MVCDRRGDNLSSVFCPCESVVSRDHLQLLVFALLDWLSLGSIGSDEEGPASVGCHSCEFGKVSGGYAIGLGLEKFGVTLRQPCDRVLSSLILLSPEPSSLILFAV